MDNNYQFPTPNDEQTQQPVSQQPEQPMYQQPQQPMYQQPQQPVYQQPVYNAQPAASTSGKDVKAMVFSIIGLACSCSFYLSILGIIFSAIGLGQSKKCIADGLFTVKTKLGKIFGIIGLVFGILCTIGLVVVIIVAIADSAARSVISNPYYYYY